MNVVTCATGVQRFRYLELEDAVGLGGSRLQRLFEVGGDGGQLGAHDSEGVLHMCSEIHGWFSVIGEAFALLQEARVVPHA